MARTSKKCSTCNGKGTVQTPVGEESCKACEGSGIVLYSQLEEDYNDAASLTGDRLYPDDNNFLDIEEEDYEL